MFTSGYVDTETILHFFSESDLHSNEHYLSSIENQAWKTFRPVFPVSYSSLHEFIMNDHNDELPVGFLAQLVEQCTDTAEVMGSKSLNFLEA